MLNIYIMNLILCAVILALGLWAYQKNKNDIAIYIALAFGLFGSSHLAYLIGIEPAFATLFLFVRMLGYLLVIIALFRAVVK
ncbi:MAG: hypothetical protein KKB81_03180 [Candidatus Margulisbacteria bacterium]|nr:hypothetical protein [Candidatus Margulisiibacteriota bacterium]MBU1022248.1 hypothetical protein [Candidatus Margulisiibacteriota bacterium]MBU1729313.1 hypothetical protein [Candidatus Margulisiibacteriota bacterium]MBU1955586.1 hypothetical protein [Candidatus Margulisiibacteriota bacterium]